MKAKRLVSLIGLMGLLAVVAATTMAVARPSAQGATAAKQPAVLEFSITMDSPASIGDPDFDLLRAVAVIRSAAKVGSPDPDGFGVDSFFDITYKKGEFGLPSPGHTTLTVVIHAVPNGPGVDPVAVINNVKKELDKSTPAKKDFKGHVTLMK